MKIPLFLLTLALCITAPTQPKAGILDKEDPNLVRMRITVKQWALDNVRRSFFLTHRSYKDRFGLDKPFFTKNGCETFIDVLENYSILELLKKEDSKMKAEYWDRRKRLKPIEQIVLHSEVHNPSTDTYTWTIEVPITLEVDLRFGDNSENFLALVDVKQTHPGQNKFLITGWRTILQKERIGLRPEQYDPNRHKITRRECANNYNSD